MLYRFLKLIPNQLYKDNIGYIPEDRNDASLAKCFVKLAKDNAELAANVIAAYIKEDIKIAKEGKIAPQTIPNHIKPIKVLLDYNQNQKQVLIVLLIT